MNGRQVQGAALMLTMMGILVIPGVVFNNLQNNGLIQPYGGNNCNSADNLCETCTTLAGGTCVLSASTGCSVSASYCKLSGSSISFLNTCSPFTGLITFNFATFVESFFSNCGQAPSATPPNTSTQYAQGTWTISSCTVNNGPPLVSGSNAFLTPSCFAVTPALTTPNGTLAVGGPWSVLVSIGGGTLFSCLGGTWNGVIGNTTTGSVPTSAQTCIQGYGLPAGCTALTCSPTSNSGCLSGVSVNGKCVPYLTINTQCQAYGVYGGSISSASNRVTSFTCFNLGSANQLYIPGVTSVFQGFNITSIIAFAAAILGAVIYLYLSLGLGFTVGGSVVATGGSVGFTTNPQGTKLAQTFGFAMLLWLPLWSEFSPWFASGFLPYGLDGTVGIVGIVLIAGFFIGAFLLSQTGTAAAQ